MLAMVFLNCILMYEINIYIYKHFLEKQPLFMMRNQIPLHAK